MNILQEIEKKYRDNKNYGITFSIDSSAYDCRLGDRVCFGQNTTDLHRGTFYNYQDVLLDGKEIGCLVEEQSGKLLHPMLIHYEYPLADWSEEDKLTDEMRNNPHFSDEGEYFCMRFATLNQLLDYIHAS